ncbi:hypothetical protein BsWGS_07164 [Bradybaena similaris]
MERKFAKFFINLVKELIINDVDREQLFNSLKLYQSNHDLYQLLTDLRLLLNEPSKLELYDYMRPLILLQHQIEYSKRTPTAPGVKLRSVRLQRHHGESLGFAVRGGFEHGIGIFVTEVTPGSQADRQGLRVGDEIVRVNGFTIAEAIHDDVLNLVRSRDEIVLKVTYIGMLPVKHETTDPVTWRYVDSLNDENDEDSIHKNRRPQDIKIFIDSTGHASIGCSILRDKDSSKPGIFVEKVRPRSIAEQVGLEPGDQILEVNETSFRRISWEQAVLALKSSRQLNILIRKNAASSRLIQMWSSNLSAASAARQNTTTANTTALPASPLGVTDLEPVYSTVNKVSHAGPSDRGSSLPRSPDSLRESEIIEQELSRRPASKAPSSFPAFGMSPSVSPPSPTYSNKSSGSSVISTAAEVHLTPFNSSISNVARTGSVTENSHVSHTPALGGAAAMMAERRLLNSSGKTPGLLGPPDEFEWSDKKQDQVYHMFSSSILDGRPLLCLTYNKNADLGVDIEGGLGSPLGGKILVAGLFEGGVARKCGRMRVGDQLMMINGHMLLGVTAAEAERIIQQEANTAKDKIELYYCESTLVNDESSSTYF